MNEIHGYGNIIVVERSLSHVDVRSIHWRAFALVSSLAHMILTSVDDDDDALLCIDYQNNTPLDCRQTNLTLAGNGINKTHLH